MKILISLLVVNSILFNVNAQVKIGAPGDPDINAVLELAGSSKGLLLPRLALAGSSSPAPLSTFTAGMVIYNTANVSDVQPGYYYSDGIKWIRISNSLETWSLTGNAATNPGDQFIGTSDETDLSIKTNGTERIRIYSNGTFDIGIHALPGNMRIRMGGFSTGSQAATLGLSGFINATANGQYLYSIYNSPSFGAGFNHSLITGIDTEIFFSGSANSFTGNDARIGTSGSGHFGIVAATKGTVGRNSTGTSDGEFYGGYFSAETGGSGMFSKMFGTSSSASLDGSGAISLSDFGAQNNVVSTHNPNASVSNLYGVSNLILHSSGSTLANVSALENQVTVLSNSIFTEAYGTISRFQTSSGGGITHCYGHYVAPVFMSYNITNYRGIFIGDIALTSGTRRAFEYAGAGSNDPVVINYDGSVQIGTYTTVPNAKLSIVDGHLQSGQTTKPTISTWPNIGTGGTATLNDATDIAGIIDLDLGSGAWSSGPQVTITFNKVYANSPIVIITPANSEAAAGVENQRPHVTTNATSFTISFGAAATNGNMMRFNYHVIETVNN